MHKKDYVVAIFENGFPPIPTQKRDKFLSYTFYKNVTNSYDNQHFELIFYENKVFLSEKCWDFYIADRRLPSQNMKHDRAIMINNKDGSGSKIIIWSEKHQKLFFLYKNFITLNMDLSKNKLYLSDEKYSYEIKENYKLMQSKPSKSILTVLTKDE